MKKKKDFMKDDYLWDGSGDPDPDIRRLETVLGRLRHQGMAPAFPEALPAATSRWRRWGLSPGLALRLAAVAAALVAIGAFWFAFHRFKPEPAASPGWNVARLAGAPRVGSKVIEGENGKLAPGQMLVTDSGSRANITVDEVGEVEVEPDTRLRLVRSGSEQKRLALDRGTIHAAIWAPPGEFVVDTPSATAVDMGCAYTLQVDDSGAGLLRTTLGWVGFKLAGHEAFIPAGAVCATRPGTGPGTPYFDDASGTFRAALTQFDFGSAERRRAALDTVLGQCRKRDALTLWHVLARVDGADRGRVYDRLAALVPPPAGVTREGILRLDQPMLDRWWNELGLGDVSLWRTWERSWPSRGEHGE